MSHRSACPGWRAWLESIPNIAFQEAWALPSSFLVSLALVLDCRDCLACPSFPPLCTELGFTEF